MFDLVKDLFKPKPFIPAVGEPSHPDNVRFKAWCVILIDGRVGYIDHYKTDGRFGVRPVDFMTGRHFPNPSQHWTNDQRLKIPEELALSLREIRAAEDYELPAEYRQTH